MKEAQRCTTICNACRYCEGFCAVFPVMELRRKFTDQELKYFYYPLYVTRSWCNR